MEAEYNDLKSRMEELEDKITRAYQSTNAKFKRKKIRSMKREADKIRRDLIASKCSLDRLDTTPKRHPPSKNKRIEAKISELNKKIRRAKNKGSKERLIAKRNSLKFELNWDPKRLEGVFGDAYR